MFNYPYVWLIFTLVFLFKKKVLGSVPKVLWVPGKHSSTELYYIPGGGAFFFETVSLSYSVWP